MFTTILTELKTGNNAVFENEVHCVIRPGVCKSLAHGWETCDPCEHLIWPASEFSLSNLDYKIKSKQSSMISRY